MLKKLLCLCSILMIFVSASSAEDFDSGKSWSSLSEMENAWDGQKMIKPGDYDAVVNELEKRKNAKQIKKDKKAGNSLMTEKAGSGSESDFLSKFSEQYPLLNLTVPLVINDKEVPVGHYKVVGTKINGRVYINLCQSYEVVGKIQAVETEDDFNETDINFVKLEDIGNNTLKLIYGSMKFNAYAYMKY